MTTKLDGLIPAPHTPMFKDGELNLAEIDKQAQLFKLNGIMAVYICGTTGEGLSMTIQERIQVIERWTQLASNDLKVIVNVGHTCLKDAQRLAEFSEECNVYAISAMPPSYYKPKTVNDLVDFYAGIASAAPTLPFYAYRTPIMSGVTFPMLDFFGLAAKKIKTLAGIKYNHNDLLEYKQCTEFKKGKYEIFFGADELLLSALPYGMRAAIGSTFNYAAPLYAGIIKYYNQGDFVQAGNGQKKSLQLVNVLQKYGVLPAGKAIMRLMGIECGPTRLPVRALSEENFTHLYKELEDIDFFSYMSKHLS